MSENKKSLLVCKVGPCLFPGWAWGWGFWHAGRFRGGCHTPPAPPRLTGLWATTQHCDKIKGAAWNLAGKQFLLKRPSEHNSWICTGMPYRRRISLAFLCRSLKPSSEGIGWCPLGWRPQSAHGTFLKTPLPALGCRRFSYDPSRQSLHVMMEACYSWRWGAGGKGSDHWLKEWRACVLPSVVSSSLRPHGL